MSKTIRYLLLMLLVVIITCFLQWLTCCNCVDAKKGQDAVVNSNVVSPTFTKNPFSVTDSNGNFSLESNDNFNFKNSSFSFLTPLSSNVDMNLNDLKQYMSDNAGKKLTITGYYSSNEKNNSSFSNLGLARANSIKDYLVQKGISSEMIVTQGELDDNLIPDKEGVFHGPVSFKLQQELKETINLDLLLADINENPLVLYFDTNESETIISLSQKQKVDKILKYLSFIEDDSVTCLVVGHADKIGNQKSNFELARNRAVFARNVLLQEGVAKSKIKIVSKGSTSPVNSNDTEQGRSKNRRAIITVQKKSI